MHMWGVIAKARIHIFFNPSTAETDSYGLRSCHSNAAIFFCRRSDRHLGVI
jgi:hypothetical protein